MPRQAKNTGNYRGMALKTSIRYFPIVADEHRSTITAPAQVVWKQHYNCTTRLMAARSSDRASGVARNASLPADLSSFSDFSPLDSGMVQGCTPGSTEQPDTCPTGSLHVAGVRALPQMSGGILLFVEAESVYDGGKTRIYALESGDAWEGLDFNRSEDTQCLTERGDFAPDGNCLPVPVLGIAGDEIAGDSGLTNLGPFSIGHNNRTFWAWDGTSGVFVIAEGESSCDTSGLYFSTYKDGALQTSKVDGCTAPLVQGATNPLVSHMTRSRYRLYYSGLDNTIRVLYSDGDLSGEEEVDFSDWENEARARPVHFLWPDGSEVDGAARFFGGASIYAPEVVQQYMLLNLAGSGGVGIAELINP